MPARTNSSPVEFQLDIKVEYTQNAGPYYSVLLDLSTLGGLTLAHSPKLIPSQPSWKARHKFEVDAARLKLMYQKPMVLAVLESSDDESLRAQAKSTLRVPPQPHHYEHPSVYYRELAQVGSESPSLTDSSLYQSSIGYDAFLWGSTEMTLSFQFRNCTFFVNLSISRSIVDSLWFSTYQPIKLSGFVCENMPDKGIDFLRTTCLPVYVTWNFFGLKQGRTSGRLQSKKLQFDDQWIFLSNDQGQLDKLRASIKESKLVLEVHDCDLLQPDGTVYNGHYGVASVSLMDILLDSQSDSRQPSFSFTVPIIPKQPSANEMSSGQRVQPASWLQSHTLLKFKVELAAPFSSQAHVEQSRRSTIEDLKADISLKSSLRPGNQQPSVASSASLSRPVTVASMKDYSINNRASIDAIGELPWANPLIDRKKPNQPLRSTEDLKSDIDAVMESLREFRGSSSDRPAAAPVTKHHRTATNMDSALSARATIICRDDLVASRLLSRIALMNTEHRAAGFNSLVARGCHVFDTTSHLLYLEATADAMTSLQDLTKKFGCYFYQHPENLRSTRHSRARMHFPEAIVHVNLQQSVAAVSHAKLDMDVAAKAAVYLLRNAQRPNPDEDMFFTPVHAKSLCNTILANYVTAFTPRMVSVQWQSNTTPSKKSDLELTTPVTNTRPASISEPSTDLKYPSTSSRTSAKSPQARVDHINREYERQLRERKFNDKKRDFVSGYQVRVRTPSPVKTNASSKHALPSKNAAKPSLRSRNSIESDREKMYQTLKDLYPGRPIEDMYSESIQSSCFDLGNDNAKR